MIKCLQLRCGSDSRRRNYQICVRTRRPRDQHGARVSNPRLVR